MKLMFVAALPLLFAFQAAEAADYQGAMKSYLESSIRTWSSDPALVGAIEAANSEHVGYDQARIDAADTAWRAEVGHSNTPTITPILENPAADFLRKQVDLSKGKITEAFVTDALGLNVAVSSPTSDMWQGDEDKYTKVYPAGASGLLLGEVELDESTQTYQAQISISVVNPLTQAVIGTLTVGVDVDALN